jgi:hypothetical protein
MDQLSHRPGSEPIAWFRDLHRRRLLILDPPFQRRSVWNQSYRESFIETILLGYPAPPIFLHEAISESGVATYSVVDGKQRLTAVLDFSDDLFPLAERSTVDKFGGLVFTQLPDDARKAFWTYQFEVVYLPIVDLAVLTEIFNRLNKNVAKLTPQELRHARFSGSFASTAEAMADLIADLLPRNFPRIADSSRRQMKDVELAAQLLLLIEEGPKSFSQDDIDNVYAMRDEDWASQRKTERRFRDVIGYLAEVATAENGRVSASRLRNQADFYSLFGAVDAIIDDRPQLPNAVEASRRLMEFMDVVEDETARAEAATASDYYQAARAASNDASRRATRIEIVRTILMRR